MWGKRQKGKGRDARGKWKEVKNRGRVKTIHWQACVTKKKTTWAPKGGGTPKGGG